MNKWKGSLSVKVIIECAMASSMILFALGTFCIKVATADFIRRSGLQRKKKTDYSEE